MGKDKYKRRTQRYIRTVVARSTFVTLSALRPNHTLKAEITHHKTLALKFTSMPSRVIMVLSIFKIAALITSGLGKVVNPMLIALDRL
jgi:hypothetical protein